MAIPDFQSILKPLLKLAADGKEHTMSEAHDKLADEFGLTEDERHEMTPGGNSKIFYNRMAWAKTHLDKAGAIEKTGRGAFRIIEKGNKILKDDPEELNIRYLKGLGNGSGKGGGEVDPTKTPEEMMDEGYQQVRGALASEILDQIKSCSPQFFEQLVVDLMLAMGYGGSRIDAGKAIGRSGDGGIDGIIKEDKLGLDVVYLQAKRWESTVGRPVVQAFAGSLEGFRANKGVMITTSNFSKDAQDYVNTISKKIVLIDGERLAGLMIDHDLGVSTTVSYQVKKIDTDYFVDE